jgi:hypothetical protein
MAIFLLSQTSLVDTAKLADKLQALFPDEHYMAGAGAWLVSAEGTAQNLSQELGISEGEITSVIVAEIASYHGRADPAIWSWIKDKWEG